jgi:hypothetical protein
MDPGFARVWKNGAGRTHLWRPSLRDEGDNHVPELAVAGGVPAIVANNVSDFRSSDLRFPGVRNPAKARGVSVSRLIDELATVALTQHDSETRFGVLAARGSKREGLALLDKLDRA